MNNGEVSDSGQSPDSRRADAALGSLRRLSEFVAGRPLIQRLGLAAISGALTAAALAPIYATPVLPITFVLLIWLIDATPWGRRGLYEAAATGWAFGFGFFLAGLYWIGFAFLVDADTYAWLLPFVAVLMPGGLALFFAGATVIARAFWTESGDRILLLAVILSLTEWLRGHILTGFPWNLLGYTWTNMLPVAQVNAWIGIYGLTFLTILAALSWALISPAPRSLKSGTAGQANAQRFTVPVILSLLLFLIYMAGAWRLAETPTTYVANANLRVVHAGIPQKDRYDRAKIRSIFDQYLTLSAHEGAADITHIIWPEAAIPVVLSRAPSALNAIDNILKPGQFLMTGSSRIEDAGGAATKYFNSMHMIDDKGEIILTYDKSHLVPFGEYLPLRPILGRLGLKHLVAQHGDFSPGETGARTLIGPNLPKFGPLVCYEAIFPEEVVSADHRPEWLLNLTDDAWFGNSSGPRQHLDQALVRSIEQGLPLVRAANLGISAIIDPVGRKIQTLALDEVGVIDTKLPKSLPPTFFAKNGDLGFWTMIVIALASIGAIRSNKPIIELGAP